MDSVNKNLDDMLSSRFYKYSTKNVDERYLIYLDNGDKVIVFFTAENEKVGVEYVKNVIAKTEEMEINHIILISRDKLTPFANKYIISYPIKIEFFLLKELKFNITKHTLVPKHVLLDPKESMEIIEYYGKKCLPQIKKTDIVSRYYNAEIGRIFRIFRNEGGISYRLVVT